MKTHRKLLSPKETIHHATGTLSPAAAHTAAKLLHTAAASRSIWDYPTENPTTLILAIAALITAGIIIDRLRNREKA